MMRGSIRFWGRACLQCIGISVVAALILLVFAAGGREGLNGGWLSVVSVFPYYLLIAGAFLLAMVLISYFQIYFPLLVSMGVSRKAVIGGILVSSACMILGIIVLMGIIWHFVPDDIARSGSSLLPLLTAAMFLGGAVIIVAAAIIIRWGKKGIFLVFCLCVLSVAGIVLASMGRDTQDVFEWVRRMTDHSGIVIGAAVLIYGAAGIFSAIVNRKYEVRL